MTIRLLFTAIAMTLIATSAVAQNVSYSSFITNAPAISTFQTNDLIGVVRNGVTYNVEPADLTFPQLTISDGAGSLALDPANQITSALTFLTTPTGTVTTTPTDSGQMALVWLKATSTLAGPGVNRSIGMFEADYNDLSPTNNTDSFTGVTGNCNILVAKPSNSLFTACVGVVGAAFGFYSQGGSLGAEQGELHGMNILAGLSSLFATPDSYYDIIGAEVNIRGCTGCTMKVRIGYNSIDFGTNGSGDSEQGSTIDAAYSIASVSGTKGWKTGLNFAGGPVYGGNAISPTGTLLGSDAISPTVAAQGIDLTNFTISGNAFRSPGGAFRVTGAGVIVNTSVPTSCSGQVAGTFWSDSGDVKVCP